MDNPLSVDLKVFGKDERGIYYQETHRAIIYLNNHESIDDVFHTITHEVIHHCLRDYEEIDEIQEESLIFSMAWAEISIF